jgi:hypothetical protein
MGREKGYFANFSFLIGGADEIVLIIDLNLSAGIF